MNTAISKQNCSKNISNLKELGYFINPSEGRLACGDVGIGKLASVDTIVEGTANSSFNKDGP